MNKAVIKVNRTEIKIELSNGMRIHQSFAKAVQASRYAAEAMDNLMSKGYQVTIENIQTGGRA